MNKKINIHNFWSSHIFILSVLFLLSILSSFVLWHSQTVISFYYSDIYYHMQRIYELKDSILNGIWFPNVALNQFNQSGTAFVSLYPGLNIYPMALLSIFVKQFVNFYYLSFTLRTFLEFLIAYFSSYFYNKNKKLSMLFSIVYTLSATNLFHAVVSYDLGRSSSIVFLPLVFFGFLELIRRNRWHELSIGMTLIILSHVINATIVSVFLLCLLLVHYKEFIRSDKLTSLLKAIMVTLLLTSAFWVRFFILVFANNVVFPGKYNLQGTSFNDLLSNAFNNNISYSLSIIALIGLILGILYYKKLSSDNRKLFWIGALFLIVCSQIFPWDLANFTSIKVIQFAWRIYIIPELIFSYIFAEVFIKLFKSKYKCISWIIIILAPLLLQMDNQRKLVNNGKGYNEINSHYKSTTEYFTIKNNSEFSYLLNGRLEVDDYKPEPSLTRDKEISNHKALYGNNKFLPVELHGNGIFTFKISQTINKLSLPFLYYNGIDYQVKLDGKTVKGYPNKNVLMTINNVHKGKHRVQIIVHKTKAEIASYILSLIGLLILIGAVIKNFLKKRKNK